jgi:hypothetical protein
MIYQTFQEATRARGARKVQIENLGLEPWEADELEVENVPAGEKHKPVANYVLDREDGKYWDEWLQTRRVELNAMTTPDFIAWLDRKMAKYGNGKLVPPHHVLQQELEQKLEAAVRAEIVERILREADLEGQIAKALKQIDQPSAVTLTKGIKALFRRSPTSEWRDHIAGVVKNRR